MKYQPEEILSLKRCKKCVLPEIYPNINYDKDGVCNFCRGHNRYTYPGEGALLQELDRYRGAGKQYDCLVGVSGGKDSAYTLYKMVVDYEMNVMAYYFDNGTTAEGAEKNVLNATKKFDVPLIINRSKEKERQKIFYNNFKAWSKSQAPGMIPMWCVGCNQGYRLGAFKTAKNNKIPLYIAGSSTIEGSTFKRDLLRGQNRFFINYFRELIEAPQYLDPRFLNKTVVDHLLRLRPFWVNQFYKYSVKLISFFSWIPYDENTILKTVKKETGWDEGKGTSTSRIDCMIGILRDYVFNGLLGFTESDVKHSNMIREEMLTRDEAMRRIENRMAKINSDLFLIVDFLNEQGISKQIINELM